eukprot:TRINITY_DN27199_c0_g1_i1.p1 TRINITY_DN27199_c0_g1~~TRINITY_DN27199_c0_g1_i1.p1  ORF type:complete len:879 (+),score=153.07 TRINITY_DN27199_c0_g1_i1:105-2741(+)
MPRKLQHASAHHHHAHHHHAHHHHDGGMMHRISSDGAADASQLMVRSAFHWLHADAGEVAPHKRISAREVVRLGGVPRSILERHLEEEMSTSRAFASISFTLLLVVAYASVVISHDKAFLVNAVEDSVGFDLVQSARFGQVDGVGFKTLHDVSNFGDLWSWMTLGLIPSLFAPMDGAAVEASVQAGAARGVFLRHNRIIAGIRLSQERAEELEECPSKKSLWNAYGMPCIGGFEYELQPESLQGSNTAEELRGRTMWLYLDQSIDAVQDQLLDMETSGWLDNFTKKLEIAMPIYNAEYGLHVLIYINFFFSRGGMVWKAVIPLSNFANWHDHWSKILAEAIWCAFLLIMIVLQVIKIYRALKKRGIVGFVMEYMLDAWAMLEWFGVLCGGALIIMFSVMFGLTNDMNEAATELGLLNSDVQRVQYRTVFEEEYFPKLQAAVHYCFAFRLAMAAYPLIVLYRLFDSFSLQPRLGIVTKTIGAAMVDLFHFLIVFLSVLGVYCIFAVLLFGRALDGFVEFGRVIQSVFLSVLGLFDWNSLRKVGRVEAGLWFWTFMGVGSLILLNMLLAIIMESYATVKEETGNARTPWEDFCHLWRTKRMERRKERVPSKIVYNLIQAEVKRIRKQKVIMEAEAEADDTIDAGDIADLFDDLEIVTLEKLRNLVPALDPVQARGLLEDACTKFYQSMVNSLGHGNDAIAFALTESFGCLEDLEVVLEDTRREQAKAPRVADVASDIHRSVSVFQREIEAALAQRPHVPPPRTDQELELASAEAALAAMRAGLAEAEARRWELEQRIAEVVCARRGMERSIVQLRGRASELERENATLEKLLRPLPGSGTAAAGAPFEAGAEFLRRLEREQKSLKARLAAAEEAAARQKR